MLPDQIQKIRSDLSITQTNMTIFSDMLTELSPGREHPDDKSLLDQLHGTCRAMQSRLVELIDQVDDDKLIADLLEINDNMNNLFLRYERYDKNQVQAKHGAIRKGPPVALPVSLGAAGGGAEAKSLMDAPLIDFSGSEPTSTLSQPPSFSQVPSLANFQDDDAQNLAEWIGEKNVDTDGNTTHEFDQFLAERAAANESARKDK